MKKLLTFPTENCIGCMSSDYLKNEFPDLFPKIGDILYGEVESEKEYGFFIKIAIQNHNSGCGLSGLLHKSNLKKGLPWSIGNKNIHYDDYKLKERKVLVEVISITEKGIGLRELDCTKDLTIEKVLNADDLETVDLCKTKSEEPCIEDSSGRVECCKEIILTDVLYYSANDNAFVFKDELYIQMYWGNYATHFFTKDLKKSMSLKRDNHALELCLHDDYRYHTVYKDYNKIWQKENVIIHENNRIMRRISEEEDRHNKEIIETELDKNAPFELLSFYKSYSDRVRYSDKVGEDYYGNRRFRDNEVVLTIKTFRDPESEELYLKVGDIIYKNGGSYRLFDNECLIFFDTGYARYEYTLFFSTNIESHLVFEKYNKIALKLVGHESSVRWTECAVLQ